MLAHPGLYGRNDQGLLDSDIDEMVAAGLAGIEADHPDHSPQQSSHYRDLARAHGLVCTAGSDFHGDRKDLIIGQAVTAREDVEALRERLA